ncbi:hypothetical protein BGZ95_008328 [Linnemannia exigua]|uniref:Uncharacterized protein n=1 Tax=Linnemannia exigua TaxID=604196 RepID=A0AAD4DEM5_9FUNG|nr:hypothetical protein BGZ95_008328 [Linnemannia exigua]
MHFSTSLLGASALATMFLATTAQAQAAPVVGAPTVAAVVTTPVTGDKVNILYSNDGNGEIATEEVPFNTCFASEHAFLPYSYLTFAPKNSTINFYTDSNCETFTFGLDGYYGGYPGSARSFKWVGWDEDNLGELFNKGPISGQGEAATPGGETHTTPPGGQNPGTAPSTNNPNNSQSGQPETKPVEGSSSSSSTFFGGVVGSLIVLSVGGLIFWKTAGKKLVEDKGKGVLPYNRSNGGRDDHILLTNSGHNGQNSFEIGDEDDEEEDEVDTRRQHRSGRQERYRDEDHV